MTAEKSSFVNAPILPQLPAAMECTLEEIIERDYMYCVIGNIVNTSADEAVVSKAGTVDPAMLKAVFYNEFAGDYYLGDKNLGSAAELGSDYLK